MPHGTLQRTGVSLDRRWSVMKSPILADDTLITDWSRPTDFENLNGVVTVDGHDKLRCRFFGRDANNETATLHLSGWYKDGTGMDMGQIALIVGTHTAGFPDDFHQNTKTAFSDTLTWFEADVITLTTDVESIFTAVTVANQPSYLEIDLSKSRYHYIFAEMTIETALSIGAIYIPVG